MSAIDLKLLESLEASAAVLLAIWCSHALRLDHVAWAAFSAYLVIRAQFAMSVTRGLMRILGTAAGGALACGLPAIVFSSTAWGALILAAAGGVALYLAMTRRHGYAWFSLILTFAMALTGSMDGTDASALVTSRIAEVTTGTLAAIVTSAAFAFLAKRGPNPHHRVPAPERPLSMAVFHNKAAVQALTGALTLAAVPVLVHELHFAGATQASMTVPAVLMIHLAETETTYLQTRRRVTARFTGCVLGGLAGTLGICAAGWSALAMACFIASGVAIGRYVENHGERTNYFGTQSVLAFLVVTVPDKLAAIDIGAGVDRLLGISSGIILLLPSVCLVGVVTWAWRAQRVE